MYWTEQVLRIQHVPELPRMEVGKLSLKRQIVNIVGFAVPVVFVTATQLCLWM